MITCIEFDCEDKEQNFNKNTKCHADFLYDLGSEYHVYTLYKFFNGIEFTNCKSKNKKSFSKCKDVLTWKKIPLNEMEIWFSIINIEKVNIIFK